jgi:UPF0755 protein
MSRKRKISSSSNKAATNRQKKNNNVTTTNVPSRSDAKKIVDSRKKEGQKKSVITRPKPAQKSKEKIYIKISLPLFIGSLVLFALVVSLTIYLKFRTPDKILKPTENKSVEITIEPGLSARQIVELLHDEGVLNNVSTIFRYLEISGDAERLQAGTYNFTENMGEAEIVDLLIAGQNSQNERIFTIYGGETIEQIDRRLAENKISSTGSFIKAVNNLSAELGLPFSEGWFLSGRYRIEDSKDNSAVLAKMMQDNFNEVIRNYLPLIEDKNIALSDLIIIASLIQGETNITTQMPLIAQVIFNRQKSDMSLGLDAALHYGLKVYNRSLTKEELQLNNPYNLRVNKGLPPTAIGALSLSAIDAVLNPSDHNYYYFIHDKMGNIHLSTTYEEHLKNIEIYLNK